MTTPSPGYPPYDNPLEEIHRLLAMALGEVNSGITRKGDYLACFEEASGLLGVAVTRLRSGIDNGTLTVSPRHALLPSWHVQDNVTGERASRDFTTLGVAARTCRALNTPDAGGRFGVYNEKGERA